LTALSDRIAQFIVDRFPDERSPVELLCVDHNGTYVVPFPCRRAEDAWRNCETNEIIEAEVAGWRLSREKARGKPAGGRSGCSLTPVELKPEPLPGVLCAIMFKRQ
jgi:hypothetical protein